jgi:hypothetical protein
MSSTTKHHPGSQSTATSPMRPRHTIVDSHAPTGSRAARRGLEESKHTVRLGTFADGQRAVALTVVYSENVGSFSSVEYAR